MLHKRQPASVDLSKWDKLRWCVHTLLNSRRTRIRGEKSGSDVEEQRGIGSERTLPQARRVLPNEDLDFCLAKLLLAIGEGFRPVSLDIAHQWPWIFSVWAIVEVVESLAFHLLTLLNARCQFEQSCAGWTEDAAEAKQTP